MGYICKPGEENYVYYSNVKFGKQDIDMADDSMGLLADAQHGTQRVSLLVHFKTAEELHAALEILVDGGKVLSPIESSAYCTAYTVIEDKFGICWQLMSGYEG